MKILTQPDGSLAIRESFRFLRIACVVFACIAVLLFLFMSTSGSGKPGELGWAALGVAVLCLAGAVVDDRSFLFDATRKTLTWERSNLFRSNRGQLPFSEIKDVVVVREASRDDDNTIGGYNVRYSALLVTTGETMRLTSSHGRNEQEYRQLADKVFEVLAAPEKTASKDDEVERLVAAGRMIDAVSLMRARDGLDLNAAQEAVHKIRQKQNRS